MLTRVHFLDPATFKVSGGWLNTDALAVVRPIRLDVSAVLCDKCAERIRRAGVPAALAVRLVDGSQYVVLGDGRTADSSAVLAARRLLKARARCERAQHRPDDFTSPEAVARRRAYTQGAVG